MKKFFFQTLLCSFIFLFNFLSFSSPVEVSIGSTQNISKRFQLISGGNILIWETEDNSGNLNIYTSKWFGDYDGWSEPVLVSIGETENISKNFQVSQGENFGQVTLAWETEDDEGNINVYVSIRSTNGSWSEPVLLSIGDTENISRSPKVAERDLEESEKTLVTWQTEDNSGNLNIYTSTYDEDWSEPVLLSTGETENISRNSQVVLGIGGEAVVAWETDDGDSSLNIYSSTLSTFGVEWTKPKLLSTGASSNISRNPLLAENLNARVMAVWETEDEDDNRNIYASTGDPASNFWTSATKLSTGSTENISRDPKVPNSASFFVIWKTEENNNFNVYGAIEDSTTSGWSNPVLISKGATENISRNFQLLNEDRINNINNNINIYAVLTLETDDGDNNFNIYVSTSVEDFFSWSEPVLLSTGETENISSNSQIGGIGNFFEVTVTWQTESGNDFNVYFSRGLIPSDDWTPAALASTGDSANIAKSSQAVLITSYGGFAETLLAWRTEDGDNNNIYASFFEPLSLIEGDVFDSFTKGGLPGVTVTLLSGTTEVAKTTTNIRGYYSFLDVSPGTYFVKASFEGYVDQTKEASVTENEYTTVDLFLQGKPGSLKGFVIDSGTDQAISGATMTLFFNEEEIATTKTNTKGNYSFPSLNPATYRLVASDSRYITEDYEVFVSPEQETIANFFLDIKPGLLQGQVIDDTNDKPLSGVTMTLLSEDTVLETTSTDGSGNYSFVNVTPGSYSVKANKTEYITQTKSATVLAGRGRLVNFSLQLDSGIVSGQVTNSLSEKPVSGVKMTLLSGSSVVATTETNNKGNYSFTNVIPGLYTVKALKKDYVTQTKSASVIAGQGTVVNFSLIQNQAQTIQGQVTNSLSEEPVSGVKMTLLSGSSVVAITETNSTGNYSFSNVTPGLYTVKASKTEYTTQTKSASVTAGQGTIVNFSLVPIPARTIQGQVTDSSSGDLLSDVTMTLLSGSSVVATTLTDGNGEYSFTDVSPGTYSVKASKVNYTTQEKTATLSSSEGVELDFSLAVQANVLYKLSRTRTNMFIQR